MFDVTEVYLDISAKAEAAIPDTTRVQWAKIHVTDIIVSYLKPCFWETTVKHSK